jgi:outer membrane protein OmpA-like peptidoglycan-associated protein
MKASRSTNRLSGRNSAAGKIERRWTGRRTVLLAALLAAGTAMEATRSAAQNDGTRDGYSPSIIINTEVLDSLGPQGPVYPMPFRPGEGGSNVVGGAPGSTTFQRSGARLFPPQGFPQSRIVTGAPVTGAPAMGSGTSTAVISSANTGASAGAAQGTSRILIQDNGGATASPPEVAVAMPSTPAVAPQMPLTETPTVAVAVPELVNEPEVPAAPESSSSSLAPEPAVPSAAPAPVAATPVVPAVPAVPAAQSSSEPAVPAAPEEQTAAEEPTVPQPAISVPEETSTDDGSAQDDVGQVLASVLFEPDSADLTEDSRLQLERVALTMSEDKSMRVQLQAFAAEDDDSPNASRRLSLSRALVVRGFLIEQGIVSTRMQVRALGDKFEDGPPDRVDIHSQGG